MSPPRSDRRAAADGRRFSDDLNHLAYRIEQLEDLPNKLLELRDGQIRLATQMKTILAIVSAIFAGLLGYLATKF